MGLALYWIYIIILIIAFSASIYDLKYRRVPNRLLYLFILISATLYFIQMGFFTVHTFFIVIISLISIILYGFNIWGGADGKFIIGASFFTISMGEFIYFLEFLFNTFLLFVLISLSLSIFNLKFQDLKNMFNEIPFSMFLFQVSGLALFLSIVYNILKINLADMSFSLITLLFLFIFFFAIFLKFIHKIVPKFLVYGVSVLIILFSSIFLGLKFVILFVIMLIIRIVIYFMSEAVVKNFEKDKRFGFAPPLIVFASIGLIIEFFLKETLISFIL